MHFNSKNVQRLSTELRSAIGDRNRLIKLHSVVTEAVNNAYGEEKTEMIQFRQEVKNALNCVVHNSWTSR
jgi:hypothetical protein